MFNITKNLAISKVLAHIIQNFHEEEEHLFGYRKFQIWLGKVLIFAKYYEFDKSVKVTTKAMVIKFKSFLPIFHSSWYVPKYVFI